jgi:exopolyphosphatase/guanosine-5'-triphosphate,3'-diphosphate pyrophosphatase
MSGSRIVSRHPGVASAGRVAAVDVGTNSVLLLIAEPVAGAIDAVVERATITRLGQGVDRARRLDDEAIARTLRCLLAYRELLEAHAVTSVAAVCTSAARDAHNGASFLARARDTLGADIEIISGEREAELTFAGALSGIAVSGSVTVFDVGGGSTEIIAGSASEGRATLERAVSLDIGSVRLSERHVVSDPPSGAELAEVRKTVRQALRPVAAPPPGTTLVGVAGTVTTLAAMALELADYDASRVHGATLSRITVAALAERLEALTLAERRSLPGLEPLRADVIVAGAALVREVIAWAGVESLRVSDRGVRWGLVARQLMTHSGESIGN